MEFSEAQKKAVFHREGPMLVLAGPGSGKTTVITRRIQYLIEEAGINPAGILVITFTKAAANEMKERFYSLMSRETPQETEERRILSYKSVTFGTFHAVFFTILKHAYHLSAANIIREEQRFAVARRAVEGKQLEVEDEREFIGNVLGEIGKVKSERIDPENYYSVNCPAEAFREIYKEYTEELRKNRLIDFEDMLVYTYELLTAREDILRAWQGRYRYILIDEFQDICKVQYDIIRLLAAPENNLFIVGDDDQSIYGFRGSKPDIMLNFAKDYPATKEVLLDINYRCTPEIAAAAGRVICSNTKRFKKNIRTVSKNGAPVQVFLVKDFIVEYAEITKRICEMARSGRSYGDIAVLYRASGGIGSLVRRLMEESVPFCIKDKLPDIFEHWIAKDIFAYIRIACAGSEGGERDDFLRIVNKPKRYIGRDYLTDTRIDLNKLCRDYGDKYWIVERILKLKGDLAMLRTLAPYAAVNYIRHGMGYDDYLTEYAVEHHIHAEELFDVLDEIQESARAHDTFLQWDKALAEYKERVRELPDDGTPRVTLTTMHSSKGLEFNTVFIVDVNEGTCPHKKAVLETDIEEERRMFYVAMTRAKENLYIYSAAERYNKKLEVSRFLAEAGLAVPEKEREKEKRRR